MPYIERPPEVAEVICQRLRDGEALPPGYTRSPGIPEICMKWVGDHNLPLLVAVELEQDIVQPFSRYVPFPVERVGLVDERTALYRRTDV